MRIPDAIAKCVSFVSRVGQEGDYRGTAFVVSIEYAPGRGLMHLLTAKHVAIRLGSDVSFAVNAKDGHPRWLHPEGTPWYYHPNDPSVDVAIMPLAVKQPALYDLTPIPHDWLATTGIVAKENIGIGDEIFSVGLFRPFHGEQALLEPIIRTGTLAMTPISRVPSAMFGSIEAYLAEGRSIGGHSGSPVFVRPTKKITAFDTEGKLTAFPALGRPYILGLIHGHMDSPEDFELPNTRTVNTGISIIVPGQKIHEVLFSPSLVAAREEASTRSATAETWEEKHVSATE